MGESHVLLHWENKKKCVIAMGESHVLLYWANKKKFVRFNWR